MDPANLLDPSAVRRQFARRALRDGPDGFVLREVERRMLEHLELTRIDPGVIADLGCGRGHGLLALRARYPGASLVGVDLIEASARAAQAALAPRRGLIARLRGAASGPAAQAVVADIGRLPLATSCLGLAWSNLAVNWCHDVPAVLGEWHRALRPGGLVMFSAFGVDTFKELRAAGAVMMPFPDMHDLGDALVGAGFADPVMDMERIDLTYASAAALLDEVRALGGNARRDRARGLQSRARRRQWEERISAGANADGRIKLSLEVIYGHAWVPEVKRRADGAATVEFRRPARRG
jgi:malonyl-CoA O-methyltransferase